jgi:hypothetical protein
MKNKRGDISVGWIIGIILLLVGFVILLFIYYQFNFQSTTTTDVCHTSVILRGSSPSLTQSYFPLKCQTQKICIVSKSFSGSCEEFKNEKGIIYEKVEDNELGLRQIEKVYADHILDCWSMMGEGKIDLFSSYFVKNYGISGLEGVSPSCVICSRVAIDKKSFSKADLSNINILNYMETHYVPNGDKLTYVNYMSGSNSAISFGINQDNLPQIEKYDENGKIISPVKLDTINSTSSQEVPETAILFMQISGPPSSLEGVTNVLSDAGIILGTSAVISPKITFSAISTAVKSWPVTLFSLVVGGSYQQGSIYFNRGFTASYCGDNTLGEEAMRSCSVVRAVNYNVKDIVQYCPNIESIP